MAYRCTVSPASFCRQDSFHLFGASSLTLTPVASFRMPPPVVCVLRCVPHTDSIVSMAQKRHNEEAAHHLAGLDGVQVSADG